MDSQRPTRGGAIEEGEKDELRILYLNCRSLVNKVHEIQILAEVIETDVILLTETWAHPEINDQELKIANFNIVAREDRKDTQKGRGGGVVIYVNSRLNLEVIKEISNNIKSTQICGIKLRGVELYNIYRSPNQDRQEDTKLFEFLANRRKDCIIIGDFNYPQVDWNTLTTTSDHEHLASFMEASQDSYLTQIIKQSTHEGGNTLDLVLTNCENAITEDVQILEEQKVSDHFPLLLNVNQKIQHQNTTELIHNYRIADFNKYRECLCVDWVTMLTSKNTEEMWQIIKDKILKATDASIPLTKRRTNTNPHWYTQRVKHHVNLRKKAWKIYSCDRTAEKRQGLRKLQKETRLIIKEAKVAYEQKIAEDLKHNPKTLYTYINSKKKIKDRIGPLKSTNGEVTENDTEQANILNDYFQTVFTDKIEPEQRRPATAEDLSLVYFSPEEVAQTIKTLKLKSSPGPDGITPRLLKEAINLLSFPLSMLYNISIQEGCVPKDWKTANITPIFKKGKKQDPSNYRPISLTSHVCKIMERMLCKRIEAHLTKSQLIAPNQHGYRRQYSSTTNLLEYWNFVTGTLEQGKPLDVIYFDFSKAFDSVPHGPLLNKLPAYNIAGKVADWIEDWLKERTQRVVINGRASCLRSVSSSVPQGSVLGPILFQIYIDDMTRNLDCESYLYADDTKIAMETSTQEQIQKLQQNINKMQRWAENARMKFNLKKCAVLHFGKNNRNSAYELCQQTIRNSSTERDLGVLISDTGKFNEHVESVISKANQLIGLVKRNFVTKDAEVMRKIYETYIRPVIEYASPVWNPVQKGLINKLSKLQRRYWQGRSEGIPENIVSHETSMLYTDLKLMHSMYLNQSCLPFESFFSGVNHDFATRQKCNFNISIPRTRSAIRKCSFACRHIEEWNKLPLHVRNLGEEDFNYCLYLFAATSNTSITPSVQYA